MIVGKHGETLVVDWGLAKATGQADPALGRASARARSASGSSETLPGSALGTPAYMSPEQAGATSSSWARGRTSTAWCARSTACLTGQPPFEGDDVGDVLRAVQRGDFPPPRKFDPSIDPALEASA